MVADIIWCFDEIGLFAADAKVKWKAIANDFAYVFLRPYRYVRKNSQIIFLE